MWFELFQQFRYALWNCWNSSSLRDGHVHPAKAGC